MKIVSIKFLACNGFFPHCLNCTLSGKIGCSQSQPIFTLSTTLERYKINEKRVYFSHRGVLSRLRACVKNWHYYRQEHRHPLPPSSGKDKGFRVQAATDSYIYTFRGFSISRFVECTRSGLTPPRGTANNVRRICICQKLRRRSVRARLLSPVSKIAVWRDASAGRIPRILTPGLRLRRVTYPRVDRFQAPPADEMDMSCLRFVSGNKLLLYLGTKETFLFSLKKCKFFF